MSLVKRQIGSRVYLYFKLPGPAEIYMGPENRPDHSRVEKAIQYVRGRIRHYEGLLDELEQLELVPEDRRRLLEPEPKQQVAAPKIEIPAVITMGRRTLLTPKKRKSRARKKP
jgi:hypothetical protein